MSRLSVHRPPKLPMPSRHKSLTSFPPSSIKSPPSGNVSGAHLSQLPKWPSSESIRSKRERRRLEKRWIGSRCESDRVAYRQCCCRTNRLINNSRRDYYKDKFKACNNSGLQWKAAMDLLHNFSSDLTRSNEENQTLCHTFSAIFHSKIQSIKANIASKITISSSTPPQADHSFTNSSLTSFPPITHDEVQNIIRCSSSKIFNHEFHSNISHQILFLSFNRDYHNSF